MTEAEMVNGAGRLERAFPGIRCDWRYEADPEIQWGIAVYDERGKYVCTLFLASLVEDIETVSLLFALAGVKAAVEKA